MLFGFSVFVCIKCHLLEQENKFTEQHEASTAHKQWFADWIICHVIFPLQESLDEATDPWGIKVERVEIKDVKLPQQLQRAMAAEAEASREARAKVKGAIEDLISFSLHAFNH